MSNTAGTFLTFLEDGEKVSSHMQDILVIILIMFIKKKAKKGNEKLFDLIQTNKNSFNSAFNKSDQI